MSTNIPIASLDPTSSPPHNTTVKGIVTLVWPYSSSTRQCAFLLADPDFRLRSKKGQARVRFTGASAKAVAEKHVGIGDLVELELEGARWEEDRERSKTPGRSVDGELCFGRKVGLGIRRGGSGEGVEERVDVDAPPSPPASRDQEVQVNGHTGTFTPAPTPASRASNDLLRRSLDGGVTNGGWTYSSPAFAKRLRLSGGGGFDPFVDGEVGEGKRTSFGTGLRWRLGSRTPSPLKERFGRDCGPVVRGEEVEDVEDVEEEHVGDESPSKPRSGESTLKTGVSVLTKEQDSAVTADEGARADWEEDVMEVDPSLSLGQPMAPTIQPPADARTTAPQPSQRSASPIEEAAATMKPPALPYLSVPSQDRTDAADQLGDAPEPATEGPSTPKLQPVKSPTLPLPSPFPADAPSTSFGAPTARPPPYKANSLFGSLGNAASVIERRRLSGRVSQSQLQSPKPASLPPPRNQILSQPAPLAATESLSKPEVPKLTPVMPPAVAETVDLTDDHHGQDEDAEMLDDAGLVQESDVNHSFSTTIPDKNMYDDYQKSLTGTLAAEEDVVTREDEATIAETPVNDRFVGEVREGVELAGGDETRIDAGERVDQGEPLVDKATDGGRRRSSSPHNQRPDAFSLDGAAAALPAPRRSPRKRQPELDPKVLRTVEPVAPSTPAQKPPPGPFALDGASSTPMALRVTPQSEKERVRKSTYRSLFGLRSPQKEQVGAPISDMKERQEEPFIPGWFFEVEGQRARDAGAATAALEDAPLEQPSSGAGDDCTRSAEDVVMLDDDEGFAKAELERAEAEPDITAGPQPAVVEAAAQPSKLQVIELDASSDIEESEADGDDTPKPAVPELPSSSPVIQDSLEDSQDEAFVVSDDERASQRRPMRTRTHVLRDAGQAETSPLSSSLPETRLADLAREAGKASTSSTQQQPHTGQEVSSTPTPKQEALPTPEQDVEEHTAPPRSTAATTVVELGSSSESEEFPSSPVLGPRRFLEDTPVQSLEAARTPAQGSLYPTLPLSPSNSQSLRDMQSQPEIQESTRSKLPPTPQLTQRELSVRTEERSSQRTPAPKLLRNESSLRAEVKAAESPITPQTKTPSRRSARLRTSNVPDVLSEWFSPRSSGVAPDASKAVEQYLELAAPDKDLNDAEAAVANGHATPSKPGAVSFPAAGFATAHSYFTPLSKLPELTNPSSQHGALDLLAVVTDKTSEPVRAKTGPRDYFTIFHITDTSLPASDSTRVEVFRPYKTTLPFAEVGDVVLLRAFVVKSRKRTPFLLSTDASAWCAWRFKDAVEDMKPAWAKKGRKADFREEVKGPPVEYGEEERSRASELRKWWLSTQYGDAGEGMSQGEMAAEVAAKL